jgi:DNA-directed RNA polymerase specialized sigma24 family protein
MTTSKKLKEHYVSNKEFLAAMIEYRKMVNKAKKLGQPKPPVTNYIGNCFLKIANHLSYRPNFINYTFRDDMISDGIENCLQYLDNFNPNKSNNPFAYFTQIIYYAFIRRIQKEKKQTTIKHKILLDSNFDDMTLQPGEDKEFTNQFTEFLKKNMPIEELPKIESITAHREMKKEKLKVKKKKRVRKSILDKFIN